MILSKMLDITSLMHLLPTFAVLSTANFYFTNQSVKIIDEVYLNNQRANLLISHYLETGEISSVHEVNKHEYYWVPNFMNKQIVKYI